MHSPQTIEWLPATLGLDTIDLKAAGPFTSKVLNVEDLLDFHLNGVITETGTSTLGEITVSLIRYAADGTTVLDTIDLLTVVSTTDSGAVSIVFGRRFASAEVGLGTIGSNVGLIRVLKKVAIKITVVTANNGTTCTASFWLQGSP